MKKLLIICLFCLLILSAISLTACNSNKTYQIVFNAGKYGTIEGDSVIRAKNTQYVEPLKVKAEEGYKFIGWENFVAGFPTKDVTYNAIYEKGTYTFEKSGGEIELVNGTATLPNVLLTKQNMLTNIITTESVSFGDIEIIENDYVYSVSEQLHIKEWAIIEFETDITLLLKNSEFFRNGICEFTFKAVRKPVKVNNVTVIFGKAGIQIGGTESLSRRCVPSDASYQDVEYFIEYVIINGTKQYNYENYASIEYSTLKVTNNINIDDKIGVRCKAIVDDIYSEVLEIKVLKIPVISNRIIHESFRRDIIIGEEMQFRVNVYPYNASFPEAKLQIVSGGEYCEINETALTVKAFKDVANIGKEIVFKAIVDGVESENYTLTIYGIEVETVKIRIKGETSELADITYVNYLEEIQLDYLVNPIDATIVEFNFKITTGYFSATITSDGKLVFDGEYYFGAVVKVYVSVKSSDLYETGINSKDYTFILN